MNYDKCLNKLLPDNIRIIGISAVEKEFNARYACTMREYHYIFCKNLLNIEKMCEGCKKFLGKNDFRNFCKMNLKNSVDHNREILDIKIEKLNNYNTNKDPRFEQYILKI